MQRGGVQSTRRDSARARCAIRNGSCAPETARRTRSTAPRVGCRAPRRTTARKVRPGNRRRQGSSKSASAALSASVSGRAAPSHVRRSRGRKLLGRAQISRAAGRRSEWGTPASAGRDVGGGHARRFIMPAPATTPSDLRPARRPSSPVARRPRELCLAGQTIKARSGLETCPRRRPAGLVARWRTPDSTSARQRKHVAALCRNTVVHPSEVGADREGVR